MTSRTSASKGKKGMEGAGGMVKRGGERPVGGRQLESPSH